jgi:murein DD-endopeptidase MepM/ murein hydrolase activator NlpD
MPAMCTRVLVSARGRMAVATLMSLLAVSACETPSGDRLPSPPTAQAPAFPTIPVPVPRPPRADEPLAAPAAARPAEHVVAAGEDLYSIALRYDLDAYQLAIANDLSPPFTVTAGQTLRLDVDRPAVAAAPDDSPTGTLPTGTTPGDIADGQGPVQAPSDGGAAAAQRVPPTPPAVLQEGFIWPVTGTVISSFGDKGGGLYNDGINIAAAAGTPVRAAEDGVVAYAGNELRGFGNMLLIRHADGWMTTYAHAEELLVNKGERVSKGQVIARVGSTGGVSRPQLHFEMRKGKKPVDPLTHLRRVSAQS